jgi:phosphoglycerate kinase
MRKPPVITDAPAVSGKTVLVRTSLNVPVTDGSVRNDFRLRRGLKTIEYLQKQGARVVVAGHIGRDPAETLEPVARYLQQHIECSFVGATVSQRARDAVAALGDGDVLILENLRSHGGETDNDPAFTSQLASLADLYVNDAFAASHREHASIVGVPQRIPGYAGLVMEDEIMELARALDPDHPALFIVGGAKFETKEPLIEKFLNRYETIFVGGALAHILFAARGWRVGKSLMPDEVPDVSGYATDDRIVLPQDVVVENSNGRREVKEPSAVSADDTIYDAGPQTVQELAARIQSARFVVWNGPLGNYEKGYAEQTEELARQVASAGATSLIGGGDTVASISALELEEQFSFISTGGGAMLAFLTNEDLPGIAALRESHQ